MSCSSDIKVIILSTYLNLESSFDTHQNNLEQASHFNGRKSKKQRDRILRNNHNKN